MGCYAFALSSRSLLLLLLVRAGEESSQFAGR